MFDIQRIINLMQKGACFQGFALNLRWRRFIPASHFQPDYDQVHPAVSKKA
jgi:hypothetical protein